MIKEMNDLKELQTIYINEFDDEELSRYQHAFVIYKENGTFKYCTEWCYYHENRYNSKLFDEQKLNEFVNLGGVFLSKETAEEALVLERKQGVKDIKNKSKEEILNILFEGWTGALEWDEFSHNEKIEMEIAIKKLFGVKITNS